MSDFDLKSSVTLTDNASPTLKKLQSELTQTGRSFDGMDKSTAKAGSGLGSLTSVVAGLGIAFSASKIASTAYDLGNLGSQAITTEKAFRNVMAAAGQSASILNQYKAAADGTIGSTTLMRAANLALAGTTGELSSEMARLLPTLIQGARAAAALNPAYGDASFMLDSLVSGVKRGSPRLIDNTGIVLKLGEANDALAAKLGKSVDELTSQETSLAILYATADAVPTLMGQVGDAMDDTASASTRLAVAWQALRTEIGKKLSPGVVDAQTGIAGALNNLTSIISSDSISRTQAALDSWRQTVNELNSIPVNPGGALSGGQFFFSDEDKVNAIANATSMVAQFEAKLGDLTKYGLTPAEARARQLASAVDVAGNSTQTFGVKVSRLSGILLGIVTNLEKTRTAALKAAAAMDASAAKSVTGGLLGDTSLVSLSEYKNRVGAAETAINVLSAALQNGAIDQETYDYQVAQATQANTNWVSGMRDAQNELNKTGSSVDTFTTQLENMIAAQLQPSFSLGDLAPELTGTEGNLDEHYRRLAAIALRGGEEIAAHQADWQDTLALIPPEVKSQGVGAIQEWAKSMVVAYDKGLDFSLIDRDALKQRILAQLKANEMRDAVIAELSTELGGSVSAAKLAAAAGEATGTGAVGKQVSAGIQDSIDVSGALTLTAKAINDGAKTFEKELKGAGGTVGGVILGGIQEAVTGGAGDIVNKLADALAPSVAAILARQGRRTGEQQ